MTVLVWVLFLVQYTWAYRAVAHGTLHPFMVGDGTQRVELAPTHG